MVRAKSQFNGVRASQTQHAFALWKEVLEKEPFARVVELGTYKGGFSMYLMSLCGDKEFVTYDYKRMFRHVSLNEVFRLADIFGAEEEIADLIKESGQTILFCDGGDKAREFNMFAKYLKSGDIIAAHDWCTEIHPEDIKQTVEEVGLVRVYEEEAKEDNMTVLYRKV